MVDYTYQKKEGDDVSKFHSSFTKLERVNALLDRANFSFIYESKDIYAGLIMRVYDEVEPYLINEETKQHKQIYDKVFDLILNFLKTNSPLDALQLTRTAHDWEILLRRKMKVLGWDIVSKKNVEDSINALE